MQFCYLNAFYIDNAKSILLGVKKHLQINTTIELNHTSTDITNDGCLKIN